MKVNRRQNQIYDLIRVKKHARVIELTETFNVTDMTIRRDLEHLEKIGLVERFHGGANIVGELNSESAFAVRLVENFEMKASIARKAVDCITDGLTMFVDGSTTCNELVKLLSGSMHLTVFTDSVEALIQLRAKHGTIDVLLIGGALEKDNNTLDGYMAVENIQKIFVDACFISCGGFSADGITNTGLIGTQVKKIILTHAKKKYLLADSTKYNKYGLYMLGDWQNVDKLITDSGLDKDAVRLLAERGANVEIAPNLF